MTAGQRFDALKAGATGQNLLNYAKANPFQTAGMVAGPLMAASENNNAPSTPTSDSDRGAMANAGYQYDPGWANPTPAPDPYGREQTYNRPRYYIPKAADGGEVINMAGGGISGSGSLHVDVPISVGGGAGGQGGGSQNGYTPVGGGFGGGNGIQQGGTPQSPMGGLGGLFGQMLNQGSNGRGDFGGSQSQGSVGGNFNPFTRQTPQTYESYASSPTQEVKMSRPQWEAQQNNIGQMQQQGRDMVNRGNMSEIFAGLGGGGYGGGGGGGANMQYAAYASGGAIPGQYNLGSYSDGGRLLRGPGDGVSDSIPAVIGQKQPARLADGEFVVPARIVSEIGNGSTEAGARKLYAMMDRVQKARTKTVGKGRVAKNTRADKYLPA
jgi:hypothetical protein